MDTSPSSATAATSPSSPGAGSYNIPGDNSPKMDASEEDSKFKDDEIEEPPISDIQTLTIEDSTLDKIPPHLQNLLSSFDVMKSEPVDLLIALIYGVALECSFAAIEEIQRNLHRLKSMSYLSTFHVRNVRLLSKMPEGIYDVNKMVYTIRLQLIFDQTETSCVLTGIVTGDLLILTLTPDCGDGGGKSICLSVGRYVLNSKGRPFASRFRKLPELSFKLREHVLIPIRNYVIRTGSGLLLYPGLDGLPEELYPYLYVFMNKNSLNKMANVSKRLRDTVIYYKKRLLKNKKLNK